ncbi:hypothetical protein FHX42_005241 [Saccharopolyspora lacisalsi]|uniref:Uncharacterized protein n=1 Tax=Halosaccharopolyspora lacisalsi TaxID=1000566 RepID=A0A839E1W3_9PSEU|nr:hypothetical protein [Halosaccharopolyspora lacisalsi]
MGAGNARLSVPLEGHSALQRHGRTSLIRAGVLFAGYGRADSRLGPVTVSSVAA